MALKEGENSNSTNIAEVLNIRYVFYYLIFCYLFNLYQSLFIGDVMVLITDAKTAMKTLSERALNDKTRYKVSKAFLSIELKNGLSLNGEVKPSFSTVSDGSIITIFDKTPFPKNKEDVVCPHFVELKWANGCNFDCAWCYLNGTFRMRPMKKKPYLKDKCKVVDHIKSYLEQNDVPSLLNSGELSDSLAFEGSENALSKLIIPLFKTQQRHKLLIVTKSANVGNILHSNSQDNVIVSFSINAFEVAKRWEKKAPHPKDRITAAKQLHDDGYVVRIRIDPIVPIDDWRKKYEQLIDYLFSKLIPERITIGSLRGLQSTINNSHDKTWTDYLDEKSNWGKKISLKKRFEMYSRIIKYLEKEFNFTDVGLCKETVEMWDELGRDYREIKCNCIL